MKRFLLLVIVPLMSILPLMSEVNYSIKFDMSNFMSEQISIGEKVYSRITCDGLENWVAFGESSLPYKEIFVSVPYNADDFSLECNTCNSSEIVLSAPIYKNTDIDSESVEYYNEERISNNARIISIGFWNGIYKVIQIVVFPAIEQNNSNNLIISEDIDISLNWNLKDLSDIKYCSPYAPEDNNGLQEVQTMVINPEDVTLNAYDMPSPNSTDQEDWEYIIICPRDLMQSLQRLAAWRRVKGYGSQIFSIESVLASNYDETATDDAAKLRAFIKHAYNNYGTRNVLLAGKYPKMPIKYITDSIGKVYIEKVPTDVYFSSIEYEWPDCITKTVYPCFTSQVNVGRIPFSNSDEVDTYIDKVIKYELNPGNNDSHYLGNAILTRHSDKLGTSYNNYNIPEYCSLFSSFCDFTDNVAFPTGADVIRKINNEHFGVHTFIGHGSPEGISVRTGPISYYGICGIDSNNYELEIENGNGIDLLTNYDYPAWAYSNACCTMPFDTYKHYNSSKYKYNIGESYLLNKGGGVLFFGNTRDSARDEGVKMLNIFFKNLRLSYGNTEYGYGIKAGKQMSECRELLGSKGIRECLLQNLLGDPLINLYFDSPRTLYNFYNENTGLYSVGGHKGEEPLYICKTYLTDETYASQDILDPNLWTNIPEEDNTVRMITGPGCLPTILPTTLNNFFFEYYIPRYIITGDLIIGDEECNYSSHDLVVFKTGCDITIESLGNVTLGTGISFYDGCNLYIKATGNVTIDELNIPSRCNIRIEANSISYDDELIYCDETSTFELIERNPRPDKAARLSRSVTPEAKMVVEGRTWWYEVSAPARNWEKRYLEIGIGIGEEVEVDGMLWHEIDIVADRIGGPNNEFVEGGEKDICIGYIREDGEDVYVMMDRDGLEKHALLYHIIAECSYWGDLGGYPFLLYHFGNPGDKFVFGHQKTYDRFTYAMGCTVDRRDEISSAGNTYVSDLIRCDENLLHLSDTEYRQIEGIGMFPAIDNNYGEWFFMPMYAPYANFDFQNPELRYVTDAAHNVIFEKKGGTKLWETLGVTDAEAISAEPAVKWYNLQGVEIEEPSTAGVYLKVTGTDAEKVTVR